MNDDIKALNCSTRQKKILQIIYEYQEGWKDEESLEKELGKLFLDKRHKKTKRMRNATLILFMMLNVSLFSQTYPLMAMSDLSVNRTYDINGSTLTIGERVITLDLQGQLTTTLEFNDIHYYGQTYICYYNFGRRMANFYITDDFIYLYTKSSKRLLKFSRL